MSIKTGRHFPGLIVFLIVVEVSRNNGNNVILLCLSSLYLQYIDTTVKPTFLYTTQVGPQGESLSIVTRGAWGRGLGGGGLGDQDVGV